MKMPLDKVAEKIVALGVPGLVLVIVIAAVGPAGGAAIVTALFVSFSGFATWGSYVFMNVGSHFLYKSQSYAVLRPDPLVSPATIVIVVEILGILGSLTFMWDVRNRTRA